jgi:hypothetical protein
MRSRWRTVSVVTIFPYIYIVVRKIHINELIAVGISPIADDLYDALSHGVVQRCGYNVSVINYVTFIVGDEPVLYFNVLTRTQTLEKKHSLHYYINIPLHLQYSEGLAVYVFSAGSSVLTRLFERLGVSPNSTSPERFEASFTFW